MNTNISINDINVAPLSYKDVPYKLSLLYNYMTHFVIGSDFYKNIKISDLTYACDVDNRYVEEIKKSVDKLPDEIQD